MMAFNLKDYRDGAIKSTLKDVGETIETLVGQVRFQHPRDQMVIIARIHHALEALQKEYDLQCIEKKWKDPLQIPGVLARVMSYLPVSDLQNCRLVNRYWSEESLSLLSRKAATNLISDDHDEDIGFGQYSIEQFTSLFDPDSPKLPFNTFNFGSSVIPEFKRLMFNDLGEKDDEFMSLEQELDSSFSDLLRSFGNHITELNLNLNEPMFATGALGCMLSYTPNLTSLHLPFSAYPDEEIVCQNSLSKLKHLVLHNGIGSIQFFWSLLRSAVNLEEIEFYSDSSFFVDGMKSCLIDNFLHIPPPPIRKNILLHLQSLSICLSEDESSSGLNLFHRLAKMGLKLRKFKFSGEDVSFSNPDVQAFLSSVRATLIHLEFHGDIQPVDVSSNVHLNIKTFVAGFSIPSLHFMEKYDALEVLEIEGKHLKVKKSSEEKKVYPKLRSLRLKNFPMGKEGVLCEISESFPNLAIFQIICSISYLQIVAERIKNLEELVLLQNAVYEPEMSDESDCGLDRANNNNDVDEFFIGNSKNWNSRSTLESNTSQNNRPWIGNLTKLRSLSLDKVHAFSSDAVTYGLSKCTGLKLISLRDTLITDEALVALADFLHPIHINVTDCDSLTYSIPYFQEKHPFCHLEY